MKVIIAVSIFFLNILCIFAQDITITDTIKTEYPVGKMSWLEWQQKAGWKDYTAKEYEIPYNFIEQMKEMLKGRDIGFVLVGAAWCGDSKKGMPEIFKLFTLLGIEDKKISLIGVNREKLDPENLSLMYNIEKVPTLIVFEGKNEIGRIVEIPLLSWYEDLLDILKTAGGK